MTKNRVNLGNQGSPHTMECRTFAAPGNIGKWFNAALVVAAALVWLCAAHAAAIASDPPENTLVIEEGDDADDLQAYLSAIQNYNTKKWGDEAWSGTPDFFESLYTITITTDLDGVSAVGFGANSNAPGPGDANAEMVWLTDSSILSSIRLEGVLSEQITLEKGTATTARLLSLRTWQNVEIDNLIFNGAGHKFTAGEAYGASAIQNVSGYVEITNSTFTNSTAQGTTSASGGGLYLLHYWTNDPGWEPATPPNVTGHIRFDNVDFIENTAVITTGNGGVYGGGVAMDVFKSVEIIGGTIENNQAVNEGTGNAIGGGMRSNAKEMIIIDAAFIGNTAETKSAAQAYGGALHLSNAESAVITDTNFIGNKAISDGGTAQGGAIWTNTDLTIKAVDKDVVFSGNQVSTDGGSTFTDNDIYLTGGNLTLDVAGGKTLTLNNINVSGETILTGGGTLHLTEEGQVIGDFVQNAGANFTSEDGATLENATFEGTVTPTGTLHVASATFESATVNLGVLSITEGNMIVASGDMTFNGMTTVNIDVSSAEIGVYTLLMFAASNGSNSNVTVVETGDIDSGNRGGTYFTDTALVYEMITGPAVLTWTGTSDWDTAAVNWKVGTTEDVFKFNTYFQDGDTVVFGVEGGKEVTVTADGVSVEAMTVGTGYTFNLTINEDNPAIYASGDLDLGNAVLNITGYTPGDTYGKTEDDPTVILADGTLSGFNPAVTILNQSSVDFLSASAYFDEEDNAIKVATVLAWYSTDPTQTHGTFTIDEEGEVFTLGANLENVDGSGEWDGRTLTKKGEGWLYLTGDNTYDGGTVVEEGYLLVNTKSLPGDAEVHADAVLKFAQELDDTYAGVLSGEGLVVKTGEGTLMLSGDSSDFEGGFWHLGGDLHLTDTARLGGTFEQEAGTTLTSEDGATLGDAVFQGTVTPEGTLNVESAIFEEATIELGHLSAENKITAAGEMFFIGTTDINVDADGIDTNETYTLMSFDGYDISEGNVVVQAANLGGNRGGHYFTDEALKYDVLVGNATLNWSGGTSVWSSTANENLNWSAGNFDTYFKTGDTVVFGDSAENKNVTVVGGVTVAEMIVEGTGYTFNLTAGDTLAIHSTGDIDLGDATLNITGLVFSAEMLEESWTIIEAEDTLTYDTINVTVDGLSEDSFLTVNGDREGNKIVISAAIDWDDEDDAATKTFHYTGSEAFTLGVDLGGEHSFVKSGTGTLILTGNNDYTGTTTVEGGTLIVDGSVAESDITLTGGTLLVGSSASKSDAFVGGDVTVGEDATLGGHGTIAGLITIESGGFFTPGSSIGSLNAEGGITFKSGATYLYDLYEIDDANSDLLVVSGGEVTIKQGAKLDIIFLEGSPEEDAEYQVIKITGDAEFADSTKFTLNNTWATVFDQEIREDTADNGYFIVVKSVTPVDDFAGLVDGVASPNAYNVADAIDMITDKEDIQPLYDALSGLPDGDVKVLASAFAQLHGEAYAAGQIASVNLQQRFVRLLPSASDRLQVVQSSRSGFRGQAPGALWNRWGTFTGELSERNKLEQFSGYSLQSFGIAAGIDRAILNNSMIVGGAFAYDNVYQDFTSIRSEDRVNAIRTMLYSGWSVGTTYIDGYAGYSKGWHETERNINIGGTNPYTGIAKSKYSDDMMSAGIEVGHKLILGNSLLVPSVGLHYVHISTPKIKESGGGVAVLNINSSQYDSLRLPIGARWRYCYSWGHMAWTPEIRAFYVGELGDTSARVRTSFGAVEGVHFDSESGSLGRNSARIGLGLNTQWSNRVNFRLDYDCELYKDTANNQFGATLGVNW